MRVGAQETAINIGFACSLLRSDMAQYIVNAGTKEVTELEEAGRLDEADALAHASVRIRASSAVPLTLQFYALDGAW